MAEQRDLRFVVKIEDDQGKLWDAIARCAHGARPPQVRRSGDEDTLTVGSRLLLKSKSPDSGATATQDSVF